MDAPVLHGSRQMSYEEFPAPSAGPDEVIVEVGLCGICGSDLEVYAHAEAPDGIVLGHEFSGTIVELGKGVEGWSLGERVVSAPADPCLNCWFCVRGETHLCMHHYRIERELAGEAQGMEMLGAMGYAPLARMRAPQLIRVPDALDDRTAASVEPAAVGYHAVRNSGMRMGDRVAVIGAGPIGLFVLQAARLGGAARIVALEPSAARRTLAGELGADVVLDPSELGEIEAIGEAVSDALGGPPDTVFDAAGVPATLQQAVELVKVEGHVMMVGVAMEAAPIQPSSWVMKRVRVRGAFAYTREDYRQTIDLLQRGLIETEAMISSVVPGSETPETFELLLGPHDEVKVLVDPQR
ncbi:MAG: zinc-binding dehydrogenase [Chloroflexi bacterium]|nr:zinc-binding dehydrogenase [Chloroflexota bacterium]